MTIVRRLAALLALALMCLFVPASTQAQQQPQQPRMFQLAFCNVSSASTIYIAITHRKDGNRWTVEGWFPLHGTGCSIIGSFYPDSIYYYAYGVQRGGEVTWAPADGDEGAATQCINKRQAFSTPLAQSPGCPDGQTSVRFRKIQVGSNVPLFTFTLKD